VAQHDEQHLTTEQLSAFADRQLPLQEQAACETHLQTCATCQQALRALRQTIALLYALPQPALPRSFTLSRTEVQPPVPARAPRSLWRRYGRSALRTVSTIAAVVGLVILLGGLLVSLPRGGGASTSTSSGSSAVTTANAPPSSEARHNNTLAPEPTQMNQAATATSAAHAQATAAAGASEPGPPQPAPAPPALATPLGLQELGFTLCVLGVVGLLLTRRRRGDKRGHRRTL
jgi:Putative zinc-finger